MGYHSKAKLLLRGNTDDVSSVESEIAARAALSYVGDHWINPKQYWLTIQSDMKKHSNDTDSVAVFDSDWFKAYGEWDEIVAEIKSICREHNVDYSYARMGESDDDFESDSNEVYNTIELRRSFTTPEYYSDIIDEH